ncbi:MAG: aldo/keto reductase [Verrucomicrobiae bacterium]|nr:aldo/keto reductase [Verrucomicrobiae bacterium]
MKIARRQFLKTSALGIGGAMLGAQSGWAATEPRLSALGAYDTVTLGRTGIRTSRVSMGTGVRGGMRESNHTRMGVENAHRLIREIHERGVRSFDLADMYGTHGLFPPALEGVPRDQYMLMSKIWFRPGGIPEPERLDADVVVGRFLKELKTDYLDLVLLHCVESATWPRELARQMEILAELKRKGVIRAHGVSCHSLAALEAVVDEPWVDSVHARINPFQMVMDGPPEKVAPVLERIRAQGKGVVGMKIIGEGRLRNDEEKKDQSIGYAWANGLVDMVTVGFEKTEELDDFDVRLRRVTRLAA